MSAEKPTFMTQAQAEARSRVITHESIHYDLTLILDKGTTFRGLVNATFSIGELSSALFIDFRGMTVLGLSINGHVVEGKESNFNGVFDGLFIQLPSEHLLTNAKNTASILYETDYATDGLGLHSFTDTDSRQYIYSQCESFWCNRIFPNFDQPDLKATMKLQVVHPSDWIALSNQFAVPRGEYSREALNAVTSAHAATPAFVDQLVEPLVNPADKRITTFETTKILPTYIYGFAAGPYLAIETDQPTYNNIPMKVYARESMIPHLKLYSDFIFEITNECMKLFVEFFGYPYPFEKYDQIFCPEFNCGAMENAGLVTFNDMRFVFKEDVSDTRMSIYLNVIAHELCHHWFGNLVTMKWWNDLWLNESFADFIGHFSLTKISSKIRRIADGWVLFNNRKVWGYNTDQLITTHPIAGVVANTEEAESIFDGITYAKGAATIRQLLSMLGEDRFSAAMKVYFHKFQFKNAELKDFIETLDAEFVKLGLDFTLNDWQNMWIQTAGLNECYPVFDPSNTSENAALTIQQTCASAEHLTLRRHNMKIAFFDENCAITEQTAILTATPETVVHYDGSKNFKAVLLNYADYAYIKVFLDPASIAFFRANLHKITDTLTRTLIWKAFYDLVRDGKMASSEYVAFFVQCMPNEISEEIVSASFGYLANVISDYTPIKHKGALKQQLFDLCLRLLLETPKEQKNKILVVKGALLSYAASTEQVTLLHDWFNGKNQQLNDLAIGNEGEWAIVSLVHLSTDFTPEQKAQIFSAQLARDNSDTSKNMEQKCRALVATPEERVVLWSEYFLKTTDYSQRVLMNSMQGFMQTKKPEDLAVYQEKWFTDILALYATSIPEYANVVYDSLLPTTDDLAWLLTKFTALLEAAPTTSVFFQKRIKETIDLIKRKQRTYACFYAANPSNEEATA